MTTPLTPEQLAELRRMHEACQNQEAKEACYREECEYGGCRVDVAARNALPALLDEIERLRAELQRICGDGHAGNTLLAAEVAQMRAERDAAIAKIETLTKETK